MVKILNDLSPDFCENCPYMRLVCNEHLGSGMTGYSCVHLPKCSRVYNIGCNADMKENNNE